MGIFSFILLLALGSFIYIYFNKEYIIHQITKAINDEVNGEIKTEDISFDIFKYFPATSVQLKEFSIRDSMYASHKMELLHAENVFVRINFKDLFSSHISIEQITLENGSIYLFTDTSGYSNKYLFKNKPDSASPKFKTGLNKLIFRDFRFVYRDQQKDKFFNVFFQKLKCDFEKTNTLLTADLDMEGKIKFLGFNTAKGFFASNTNVGSRLTINYFPAKNKLIIPASVIYLNDKSFDIKADFDLGDKPEFSFDIGSSRVLFSDVTEMVTAKIKNKLVNYKIINPVALQVHIEGPLQYRVIPEIAVKLTVKSNKVFYKETEFSKAGFDVSFTNVLDSLLPASDENSKIEILNFKADWEGISWNSDTIQVVNLKNPKLTSVVTSAFSLREVNRLIFQKEQEI
ncbi:MAG TPA: AsmA family protein [Bacteroidia bacterium]|nr:AsmA family protein [Bacteroidia bacterium]